VISRRSIIRLIVSTLTFSRADAFRADSHPLFFMGSALSATIEKARDTPELNAHGTRRGGAFLNPIASA
jgi:hypothetical protein